MVNYVENHYILEIHFSLKQKVEGANKRGVM